MKYEICNGAVFVNYDNGENDEICRTNRQFKGVDIEDFFNFLKTETLETLQVQGLYLDERDGIISYDDVQEQMDIKNHIEEMM